MSIDTSDRRKFDPSSEKTAVARNLLLGDEDWNSVIGLLRARHIQWNATDVFGPAAKDGAVYRWGVAAATGAPCEDLVEVLSRMACGAKLSKKWLRSLVWSQSVRDWQERINTAGPPVAVDGAMAVLWAASLPALLYHLDREDWQSLLGELLELHQSVLQRDDSSSPLHLMLGGELGLTLALGLHELSACATLKDASLQALESWCNAGAESISAAVASGVDARLVLASLIRCKRLTSVGGDKRLDKQAWKAMGHDLAIWIAAMTTHGGGSALSEASKHAVADDVSPDGLMDHAAKFDSESLTPAIAAALGTTSSGGRLAWEVSLPESMQHDPDAKLAVMFPAWDVCSGRTHVDYSQPETRIELFSGRSQVFCGRWETSIEVDDHAQQPSGPWQEVCEYSDDDVHYLEIEQSWTGGLLLQRQFMLIRDDRCLLFADAVLSSAETTELDPLESGKAGMGPIRYTSRIPLGRDVRAIPEEETTEIFLSAGRRQTMVLPLAAAEWRVGATTCTLSATADQQLAITMRGRDRLYAPLWFDFQPKRIKRKRTWRQLTIADKLRVVEHDQAVGYRIQAGSEQWMIYRSLAGHRSRTVLGKHLIAGFYCSRFDSGDGSHEELITVDDSESSEDG